LRKEIIRRFYGKKPGIPARSARGGTVITSMALVWTNRLALRRTLQVSDRTEDAMGLVSVLWGIFAMLWMLLALVPLLGWGNWFLIPFAAVGAIIAAIGMVFTTPAHRGRAKTGLVLNGIVIVVAVIRLHLGGGVI
jgi:hypothetical protein